MYPKTNRLPAVGGMIFGNVALLRGKVKREMLSVTIHCSAICWDVTPIVSGLPSLTGDCLLLILCM